MPAAQTTLPIHRVTRSGAEVRSDAVAIEAPLEIRVEGRPVAVTMRTPGHDRELAAGFLLSEGVITSPEDIFEISICPGSQPGPAGTAPAAVDVLMRRPESVDFQRLTRHVFTASSCGLCGKAIVDEVLRQHPPLSTDTLSGMPVPAETLFALPDALREAQATFATTGGLHASALFNPDGSLVSLHEDVGRHNALDKLLGDTWLQRHFRPQQPGRGHRRSRRHHPLRLPARRAPERLLPPPTSRDHAGLTKNSGQEITLRTPPDRARVEPGHSLEAVRLRGNAPCLADNFLCHRRLLARTIDSP